MQLYGDRQQEKENKTNFIIFNTFFNTEHEDTTTMPEENAKEDLDRRKEAE